MGSLLPNSGGSDSLFETLSGYSNESQVWSVNSGLNGSCQYYDAQAGAIAKLRSGFGGNSFTSPRYSTKGFPIPATQSSRSDGVMYRYAWPSVPYFRTCSASWLISS